MIGEAGSPGHSSGWTTRVAYLLRGAGLGLNSDRKTGPKVASRPLPTLFLFSWAISPPCGKNDCLSDPIAPGTAKWMVRTSGMTAGQKRRVSRQRRMRYTTMIARSIVTPVRERVAKRATSMITPTSCQRIPPYLRAR